MVQESNDASDLLHKASSRHATLFHQLLSPQSGLPDSERSIERLTTEAQVLLGAGTVTTTRTLSYLITHILLKDCVKITLERELRAQAVNLRNGSTSLADLEKLQYLQACVKEGLRQVFESDIAKCKMPTNNIVNKQNKQTQLRLHGSPPTMLSGCRTALREMDYTKRREWASPLFPPARSNYLLHRPLDTRRHVGLLDAHRPDHFRRATRVPP